MNRLDKTPVVAQTKDASGAPVTVNIDGFPFAYAVIMASERGDASGVPKMIADMARGDAGAVAAAYLALRGRSQLVGLGGFGLALRCSARSTPISRPRQPRGKATAVLPEFPDRVLRVQPKQGRLFTECPIWNVGKADAAVSAPTVSDVPVLIMEGDFDAATAPEWVNLITPNLKNSQLVEFPFTGHAVLGEIDVRAIDHDRIPRQPDEARRPNLRGADHPDLHHPLTPTPKTGARSAGAGSASHAAATATAARTSRPLDPHRHQRLSNEQDTWRAV